MADGGIVKRIPDAITALRLGLVPLYIAVAWNTNEVALGGGDARPGRTLCVTLLLVIGVSDVLDGWLARRMGVVHRWGAIMDAVADKLVQVAALVFFALVEGPAFPEVPWWFLALVFGRDALIAAGWFSLRRRGLVPYVDHDVHGRLASLAMFTLLLALTADVPPPWPLAGMIATAALVGWSTYRYSMGGVEVLRAGRAGGAPG